MKLSIIIPTCNRPAQLRETLQFAIRATHGVDAEIIVVNDSKDHTPSVPAQTNLRLVSNERPGVAAARNYGAAMATGELLLFLDDDILISELSVKEVIDIHTNRTGVALNLNWVYPSSTQDWLRSNAFGRFLDAKGMTTFKGWYNDSSWKDQAVFEARSVASFHLSILRSDFVRTGGYDERFPHAGFEDYDFPRRLQSAGCQFLIDTRVTVFHNEMLNMNPEEWLMRQRRRAMTRKVAVSVGYKELALSYGFAKMSVLTVVGWLTPVIRGALHSVPNTSAFDFIFFRILAMLQAKAIFDGYRTDPPTREK